MRLTAIQNSKAALSEKTQSLSPRDISHQLVDHFDIVPRESYKRRFLRLPAPYILGLQQDRIRQRLGFEIPFRYNLLSLGERFADDASLATLLKLTRSETLQTVLIPGCYLASEDVQFWLRRGVRRLEGTDVYSLQERWSQILPRLRAQYRTEVNFRQTSIESMPFEDRSFDLIATSGVLEHVRNISAMVEETARVLRSGGWAWHKFGPLYYSYGGDHCITAYGDAAGYDHLLLEEEDYQKKINDQSLFDQQNDPNLPFWAQQEQFSFAKAEEYIALFSEHFDIKHVIVKITKEGLSFRESYPERWQQLTRAGISEVDLLIKSLAIILRKKPCIALSSKLS